MAKPKTFCIVPLCGKPAHGRGYCSAHHTRLMRNGDPTKLVQKQHHGKTIKERFMLWAGLQRRKGNLAGFEDCQDWLGYCDKRGYGRMHVDGKPMVASRASYLIQVGEIPEGMGVLHKCDNPSCINPDHLFLGSHIENMNDMYAKNRGMKRGMKGEEHPQAKLNASAVRAIRKLSSKSVAEISKRFGISETTVSDIRARRTWAHIE